MEVHTSRVGREIVVTDRGEVWIIEGEPGKYRVRLAGPLRAGTWARKTELRQIIYRGEIPDD
jgi:hypothetical protein